MSKLREDYNRDGYVVPQVERRHASALGEVGLFRPGVAIHRVDLLERRPGDEAVGAARRTLGQDPGDRQRGPEAHGRGEHERAVASYQARELERTFDQLLA